MCNEKPYEINMLRSWRDKKPVADELVKDLRSIDQFEIEGLGFTTQQGVVASFYETTPVYVARAKDSGRLMCCWGLQIIDGQDKMTYIIWALGTDELERFKKTFVKDAKEILDRWMDYYGELTNTVAVCNIKSIRWLKSMGAKFENRRKINDVEYIDFFLRKKEE